LKSRGFKRTVRKGDREKNYYHTDPFSNRAVTGYGKVFTAKLTVSAETPPKKWARGKKGGIYRKSKAGKKVYKKKR